ncbi:uncharacterized protein N7483_003734 [Penicillium malachiteum]|uniref:uncharacterized protein n=1 Tax=Penicillium malachiteum TaxID=1324776 RepID=UPI0025497631|nr:uncharacterized protein N7483_003734 [Penicillium malachiteum]KAJ5729226.1 hypothetical protein N7483_003734 [Penicillium malachiteum]
MDPIIHPVFEPTTCSWQYVVACPITRACVIIDPVLDFDLAQFRVTTESAESLLDIVTTQEYAVAYLLETHIHADHLSAAYYIQSTLWARGQPHAPICAGENVTIVQKMFAHKYNIPKEELENSFDHLFHPDETFRVGELTGVAMYLPGHTADHGGYKIGPNVGDARTLWKSSQGLLNLPPETRLYVGHDYPPSNEATGRNPLSFVTVQEQKETNKHLKNGSKEEDFVEWRHQRDHVISEPQMMHQAIQVNVRGGKMPGRSHEGKAILQYLVTVPANLLTGSTRK